MAKISFCIVCMNRLHQLKQTLPENLKIYKENKNIEFVLLDYNSNDGLEDWIKSELKTHLITGRLIYLKTPDPTIFSHSHSKNMALKSAKGEIICSVNADHFIGLNFDQYLINLFKKFPRSFISPYVPEGSNLKYIPPRDVVGKICLKKEDFMKLHGFDERFKGYGFEDVDFVKRLECSGLKRIVLDNQKFLQFVKNSEDERFVNLKNIYGDIYVHYISPMETEVIYLNSDMTFVWITFVNMRAKYSYNYKNSYDPISFTYNFLVKNNKWVKGNWQRVNNRLTLSTKNIEFEFYIDNHDKFIVSSDSKKYKQIINNNYKANFTNMLVFMKNLALMRENSYKKRITVNLKGFGEGRLF